MSSSRHVIDVTAATFENDVVLKSQEVPVLLDFWADWCAPCKTLTPILERVADRYNGAFVVAKIDAQAEQELVMAFRVQGIPFGILLIGGRPVDAFQGAIDEAELLRFLARAGVEPAGPAEDDQPEDEDSPTYRLNTGRAAVARGDVAAARDQLGAIPEDDEHHSVAQHLLEGLELFELDGDDGAPAAEPLSRARQLVLEARYLDALDAVLESVAIDRGYRNDLARRAGVLVLELIGDGEEHLEAVTDFRRRLATLLY